MMAALAGVRCSSAVLHRSRELAGAALRAEIAIQRSHARRASRGLDSAFCSHVVLFDFPRDPSEYMRRCDPPLLECPRHACPGPRAAMHVQQASRLHSPESRLHLVSRLLRCHAVC